MRDVYAVKDEAERFARFLERGYRDQDAEVEQRRPWMTLIQEAYRKLFSVSSPTGVSVPQ
jgi:hypothetical protein